MEEKISWSKKTQTFFLTMGMKFPRREWGGGGVVARTSRFLLFLDFAHYFCLLSTIRLVCVHTRSLILRIREREREREKENEREREREREKRPRAECS
jgi:ribose 1,5-bisphosphokinase PhnN